MKNIRIILLTLGLILSVNVCAQDFPGQTEIVSRLPSEQTLIDIENTYGFPELRDAPGGPGLGEIIVPVGNFKFSNVMIICLMYSGFLVLRKKKRC